ncbi:ATP-binding protein [Lysinibacter sp. HNR]|uniref:ATP-binding protein n=1 Tax=Lysinibacter sp. HNR TaxID=3031408 RepID=UPI002434E66C|nr:ATP-binding protein [Lysinibacter sp. HNR]WGD37949.1 DUF4118 domain-containing protein [Lysinibacter sp. HNR]
MTRGTLHVLLGAAPGVGKTYTMLEEGRRLRDEGRDVVVALVETHGRRATQLMVEGLEVLPRRVSEHRGVTLTEMDLDAVLTRHPEFALVDELAHNNAPDSRNEKRWQDVEELLAAGINVLSTVNIQHIESLNDVVEQITGVPQRETVPDSFLRAADQVEVIDLSPLTLRDRLSEGHIYPASRIDAALSNFFRLGNLTALRELALLWLADEVDSALKAYRAEHGIENKWEARERVVVALTGGPEGETLLRRGARIAARSAGGELLAVHVTNQDGLSSSTPGALASQRSLVSKLGGSYHQVVGDDIPQALVEFARATNATQLVIGLSRRGRFLSALSGPGIGDAVTKNSGDIDVHIVNHSAAGTRSVLPQRRGSLTWRRRLAGFALTAVAWPLITWLLVTFRTEDSITSDVLTYQLLVMVVALVGGIWAALFAALVSGITLDFFILEPINTITVAQPLHALALFLYIVNAIVVSYLVDQAARRTRIARRAAAESELIASVAGNVLRGQDALQALTARVREAFSLNGVRLIVDGITRYEDGDFEESTECSVIPVTSDATATDGALLELHGPDLKASERRLLTVIIAQIDAALEHSTLAKTAESVGPLTRNDQMRSALLAAVSHDLRRPLAAATAAISGLRSQDIVWSDGDREELLATAEESLDSLSELVTNLLDVSRVQAGVLAVSLIPLEIDDVILPALDELQTGPSQVELNLPSNLARVYADPGLLQRVVVNLLSNALRYSPPKRRVLVTASYFAGHVEIRVADSGPGVPENRREDMFVPFQRLGDTDNMTGLGLGLALSKGFVEGMGGTLEAHDTPGGGLTMVVRLRAATDDAQSAPSPTTPLKHHRETS